jgi:hypothetical protein
MAVTESRARKVEVKVICMAAELYARQFPSSEE